MKKNKTKAVALKYEGGDSVPRVVAKGEGLIARQIIAKAKANGIPIEQNAELTALLSQIHLSHEIPKQLYAAVAQILVFLYYIDGKNNELNW